MSILAQLSQIDFDELESGNLEAVEQLGQQIGEIFSSFVTEEGTLNTGALTQAGLEVGASLATIEAINDRLGGLSNEIRQDIREYGETGFSISVENISTLRDALETGDAETGLLAVLDVALQNSEQDGVVVGMRNGNFRLGVQEQTITQETDIDGATISRQTLSYGAFVDLEGDASLEASVEGFQNFENGARLEYSAIGALGTEGLEGSVSGQYTQETDWGSYGIIGGANFQAPADGGETNWSAAVIGEATYDGLMGNQFGVYSFVEGGITADPSGTDPHARVGLGRETGLGDFRAGVNERGGLSATLGINF